MKKNKSNRFYGNDSHKNRFHKTEMNENIDKENTAEEPQEIQADIVADEIKPEIVDNFDAVEDGEEALDASENKDGIDEAEEITSEKEIDNLKAQVEKEKKEYLFLMAEFDNFRKRTLKEKSEIIKNAGEKVFKGLLPIVDDMERGIKASETATDVQTVRDGLILIYNKLIKFMEANGVKAYDENDDTFDADRHEAITAVPVQDEAQKGKILDTIEKGYTINDKVLRHARVVVGQ